MVRRMAHAPATERKQDGLGSRQESAVQVIDLSVYEQDDVLVDLAENNIYDDLKVLLKDDPYKLKNNHAIRVARLLIKKHRSGSGM